MSNTIKQKTIALVFNGYAVYIIGFLILATLISYIYFANMAVRTLVLVEKTKSEIREVSVRVSEMEAKRLTVQNGVSTEKAKALGFVEASKTIFVIKNSKSLSLGSN